MNKTNIITPAQRFKSGFHSFIKGIATMGYAIVLMTDRSIRRFPYVYIVCILALAITTSIICIGKARAERDSLNKRNYELQQKLDTAQMLNEAKEEAHEYCIN